jgi:hypothetical protein
MAKVKKEEKPKEEKEQKKPEANAIGESFVKEPIKPKEG